jgi:hypothetical protein
MKQTFYDDVDKSNCLEYIFKMVVEDSQSDNFVPTKTFQLSWKMIILCWQLHVLFIVFSS